MPRATEFATVPVCLCCPVGAGESNETSFEKPGAWGSYLAQFGADGRLAWARSEGGPGLNLLTHHGALALLRDGRIMLGGNFQGRATIGEETANAVELQGGGSWDFLFVVYDRSAHYAGGR